MFLARLVYFSRPTSLAHNDLDDIETKSVANNYLDSITGALFFNGAWYVQVLEGGRAVLTRRFIRIAQDPRHTDIHLVDFSPVEERAFPDWGMRCIGGRPEHETIVRRFMPAGFDPTVVTCGATLVRLMKALADATPDPEPAPEPAGARIPAAPATPPA